MKESHHRSSTLSKPTALLLRLLATLDNLRLIVSVYKFPPFTLERNGPEEGDTLENFRNRRLLVAICMRLARVAYGAPPGDLLSGVQDDLREVGAILCATKSEVPLVLTVAASTHRRDR